MVSAQKGQTRLVSVFMCVVSGAYFQLEKLIGLGWSIPVGGQLYAHLSVHTAVRESQIRETNSEGMFLAGLHDKRLGEVSPSHVQQVAFVVEESNLQLSDAPRVGTFVGDKTCHQEFGTLWPVLPRCAHNPKVVPVMGEVPAVDC